MMVDCEVFTEKKYYTRLVISQGLPGYLERFDQHARLFYLVFSQLFVFVHNRLCLSDMACIVVFCCRNFCNPLSSSSIEQRLREREEFFAQECTTGKAYRVNGPYFCITLFSIHYRSPRACVYSEYTGEGSSSRP